MAAIVAELPRSLCKAEASKSSANLGMCAAADNIGALGRRDGRSWWLQDGCSAVAGWVPSACLPRNQ